MGKLLERIINKRLISYLESNSLLAPTQSGYRQNHSTEDQLAYFTQEVEDAFQEKKKVLAVYFDLSKAFDTVWKDGLLLKLLRNGVSGKMYKWLSDFLLQRTARVKLDEQLSNLVKMKEGVPQGGVISSTLFLVYINDLVEALPRHVLNTLHADDLAVWYSDSSTAKATYMIQNTIQHVSDWANSWALNINKSKTVSTLFSLSTSKENVKLTLDNHPVPQVETPTFLGTTLDSRLSWKAHIETTEKRAYKKLSLMKKLAGTRWGANGKILGQVYTGAIRPIMEYASTSWITASKTNKSKLDKVQNTGLRTILGAMKTTPIMEMEKTADLEPLDARREFKTLVLAEKVNRLPTHPLHTKLNSLTKNRLKRQSLNHTVKSLRKQRGIQHSNAEILQPDTWTPRKLIPQIRPEVPGLGKKGEQPPALQKSLTQELLYEKYPQHSWIHAYTDGSAEKAVRNGGSGIYIKFPYKPPTSLSFPVGKQSSNYRAELQALIKATQHLIETREQDRSIVILTDSLSALQALSSGSTESSLKQLQDNSRILSQKNNVVFQWIPAHVGIPGNEAADKLAKEGGKLLQPHNPVSYNEAKTQLKLSFKEQWKKRNDGYCPKKDSIHSLTRKEQTTIFRLRTGHCGLNKHLKRIGVADTANCQCGADEQTTHHFLQSCSYLEGIRQEVWSTCTSFHNKLWGDTEDLQKTVQFVTASKQQI